MVSGGELMLGVVRAETNSSDLKCIPVLSDSLVLVGVPRMAEMFDRQGEEGLWTDIPWIMRESGSGTRKALESALLRQGVGIRGLNVSITVQNTEAMLRCLLTGMGVSVTSRMVVQDALASGRLVELDVPALHFQRNFHVVFHKKRTLFPAGQKFLEYLQERLTFHGYPAEQGQVGVTG
jgi:DNA-binding transcriptional LysR family regulator